MLWPHWISLFWALNVSLDNKLDLTSCTNSPTKSIFPLNPTSFQQKDWPTQTLDFQNNTHISPGNRTHLMHQSASLMLRFHPPTHLPRRQDPPNAPISQYNVDFSTRNTKLYIPPKNTGPTWSSNQPIGSVYQPPPDSKKSANVPKRSVESWAHGRPALCQTCSLHKVPGPFEAIQCPCLPHETPTTFISKRNKW